MVAPSTPTTPLLPLFLECWIPATPLVPLFFRPPHCFLCSRYHPTASAVLQTTPLLPLFLECWIPATPLVPLFFRPPHYFLCSRYHPTGSAVLQATPLLPLFSIPPHRFRCSKVLDPVSKLRPATLEEHANVRAASSLARLPLELLAAERCEVLGQPVGRSAVSALPREYDHAWRRVPHRPRRRTHPGSDKQPRGPQPVLLGRLELAVREVAPVGYERVRSAAIRGSRYAVRPRLPHAIIPTAATSAAMNASSTTSVFV
jgi:hypothetical protein